MATELDGVQELLARRTDALLGRPRSDAEIVAAEVALGARFSPSFRAYLGRWGTVNVPGLSLEYLGLFDADEPDLSKVPYPNVVSQTLRARSRGLPPRYVMVRNENGTRYVCLDAERRGPAGEWLVTRWDAVDRVVEDETELDFAALMRDEIEEREEYFGSA